MKKAFKTLFGLTAVAALVAGVGYAVYKYFKPDYEEEFMDDIDDAFDDDDFFEDEDEGEFAAKVDEAKQAAETELKDESSFAD